MRRVGTKYLLLCVALIAACLAFMQIPVPPPTVIDINGDSELAPNAIHSLLFNLRGIAYIGGISIFMHAICTATGLKTLSRWIASVLTPTIACFAYHLWWVDYIAKNGIHHPITISPATVLMLDLISFTIGTAIVSRLFAALKPFLEAESTTSAKSQITIERLTSRG